MKRNFFVSAVAVFFAAMVSVASVSAQTTDTPKVISVKQGKEDPKTLDAECNVLVGPKGASSATVSLLNESKSVISSTKIGRSAKATRVLTFDVSKSGRYGVQIAAAQRDGSPDKVSDIFWYDYSYPLFAPAPAMLNEGNGVIGINWQPVLEATGYVISYTDTVTGKKQSLPETKELSAKLSGLDIGHKYQITVSSVRGKEQTPSAVTSLTARKEKDRKWDFTYFGQSSSFANTMEMIDQDAMKFKLNSCTYDPATKAIIQKGGKFTTFHDGISYYYTVIDPDKENFDITATFTVNYINNPPDGQEGFGIVAMDSLGKYGDATVNHYTNSASVLCKKIETHVNDVKFSIKDGLGARFVSGMTPAVITGGDSAIAQNAVNYENAFAYDSANQIMAGQSYRIRLVKDNSGYKAICESVLRGDDQTKEFRMWDADKLRQLDKDHVYVGFAVARGCNVTVSDVVIKITDPKTDAPKQEEPPTPVQFKMLVDSPNSYNSGDYPFVFNANSDGTVSVKDKKTGKMLVKNSKVKANVDFKKNFKFKQGFNQLLITFEKDKNYKPSKKEVISMYDYKTQSWDDNFGPQELDFDVICMDYAEKILYVSPNGNSMNKGTKSSPLDLMTAIKFAKPGQPIYMKEGIYRPSIDVLIPRGNSGTKSAKKVLMADPEATTRPVINLSASPTGMAVWGDWWHLKGFDITETQDAKKGLQIAGNNNIVELVNAYRCGDTGIQISGQGSDTFEKWPKNNLILNCTSWGNCDAAQNNADGFAAKLTVATGNVFRGCIAYNNIDDGWDLFSKIESGPIGEVLIENCVAYGNGRLPDGSGKGDGNGFKLGGDGIAVKHILRNSISFDNGANGITSNSDPAVRLENVTTWGNSVGVELYGKGKSPRSYSIAGIISGGNNESDNSNDPKNGFKQEEFKTKNNYFFNGAKTVNSEKAELNPAEIFKSIDYKNIVPGRKADGSIDMKGLFELTDKAPANTGAIMK